MVGCAKNELVPIRADDRLNPHVRVSNTVRPGHEGLPEDHLGAGWGGVGATEEGPLVNGVHLRQARGSGARIVGGNASDAAKGCVPVLL